MKRIFLLAAFILAATSFSSFAQIQSATLRASGLTCSMCSKAIYKALTALPAVQEVTADLESSSFGITFKTGSSVNLDDVKKAVENAGFSIAALEVTANFPTPVTVENDTHIVLLGNTYHFLNVPKQMLSGLHRFAVVDKNFVPAKEFKRYEQMTAMPCIHTGMMAACCSKDAPAVKPQRVYHVTLL